ncbi:PREDICTED: pectinesterase 1-like [Camelina sativa]|uniref:Pectinesterase 1-like n=1 Tax=Camelina sativa TaxID=90675 RepID=A0ABM0XRH4_CAMSA|nr:PREDICTED: pectinesterase 1-like [Camelina sativa]
MESCRGCQKLQRSWIWQCLKVVDSFSIILTAMLKFVVGKALFWNRGCEVKSSSRRILTGISQRRVSKLQRDVLWKNHVKIFGVLSELVSPDESVLSSLKVCDEMIADSLEYLRETIERFDEFGRRELVSNSLAIVTKIFGGLTKQDDNKSALGFLETESSFPDLFGNEDRKGLMMTCNLTPNVKVAKDGTGKYRTISEAVASVPEKISSRFVIHVKEGHYVRNVNVTKIIVMYGDEITKTVVSGSLNRNDKPNIITFQTATSSVNGKGFVGRRDIELTL